MASNLRGVVLDVTGTPGSDIIFVYNTGQQVILLAFDANFAVTQNNWQPAQVGRVQIKAGDGNDLVFTAGRLWAITESESGHDFLVSTK